MGPEAARRRIGFVGATFRCLLVMGLQLAGTGVWGERRDVIGVSSSTALVCCYACAAGSLRPGHRSLFHHSTLSQSRNGRSMTLAKCILSQNVRRVRVCKRSPLVPDCNVRLARCFSNSRRADVFMRWADICWRSVFDGFHQAGLGWALCILNPISQMTPVSSRAMATLILL